LALEHHIGHLRLPVHFEPVQITPGDVIQVVDILNIAPGEKLI